MLDNKIENKIQIIIQINDFVRNKPQATLDEYDEYFQSVLTACQKECDEKTRADYKKLCELHDEEDLINEKFFTGEEWLKKENEENIKTQVHRLLDLTHSVQLIEKDDFDAAFLYKINKFGQRIIKKRRQVIDLEKIYSEDKARFFTDFFKQAGVNEFSSAGCEVYFAGPNVNLIVPDAIFDGAFNANMNSYGEHLANSVFNIVKSSGNDAAAILREEGRNLIESAFIDMKEKDYFVKQLRCQIKIFPDDSYTEQLNTELIKNEIRPMFDYVFQIFSELAVDFDSIPDGKINIFLSRFLAVVEKVPAVLEKISNEKYKSAASELWEEIKIEYIELLRKVYRIYFSASKIDKRREAQAALILFVPEEIKKMRGANGLRKAENNLAEYDQRFEVLVRLQPLVVISNFFKPDKENNGEIKDVNLQLKESDRFLMRIKEKIGLTSFFYPENVRYIAEYLEKYGQNLLDSKDIDNIKLNLKFRSSDIKGRMFFDNPYFHAAENVIGYLIRLKTISTILSSVDLLNTAENLLSYFLINYCFLKDLDKNDFSEMEKIVDEWPLSPESLKNALYNSIDITHIIASYSRPGQPAPDKQAIMATNFWKFLIKAGLDKTIEENL